MRTRNLKIERYAPVNRRSKVGKRLGDVRLIVAHCAALANSRCEPDAMHEVGEARIGSDIVETRIAVDPNHEEVLILKRLLEILKRLVVITEACIYMLTAHYSQRRIIAHSRVEQKAKYLFVLLALDKK